MKFKAYITSILLVLFFFLLPGSGSTQSVFIEEDFDSWLGTCPTNWDCIQASGCVGPKCSWNRQDAFSLQGMPAFNDCGGNGLYARCHTVDLLPGETPLLASFPIDLSTYTDTTPLHVFFCLINTSIGPTDSDTVWLETSSDGGLSWQEVWHSDTVYATWTNKKITIPQSQYSSSFKLRFKGSGNKSLGDIGLDNIEFRNEIICSSTSPTLSMTGDNRRCVGSRQASPTFTSDYAGSQNYQFFLTDTLDRVLRPLIGDSLDVSVIT